MSSYEVRNVSESSEKRELEHGRIEPVRIGDAVVARFQLRKGWKWSTDIKPIAMTEWCEVSHFQYIISGRFHMKMRDGSEFDLKAGDVVRVSPGHDAWVVGDEPVEGIEFTAKGITDVLSRMS